MSDDTRFRQLVVNEEAMLFMTNMVSVLLKRKMTKVEIEDFFQFVKSQSRKNWKLHTPDRMKKILVANYLQSRFTMKGRNDSKSQTETIDMHEIMKLQIGATDSGSGEGLDTVTANGVPQSRAVVPRDPELGMSLGSLDEVKNIAAVGSLSNVERILGKNDEFGLQLLFNPDAAKRHNHIILDSRWRLSDSDGTREMAWDFLNNSTTNGVGVVNSLGTVKNIVAIRVYPIRIPYNDVVFVPSYKRVSMLIKEFASQSFIGQEGRRFHFMFAAEADENMITLTPLPFENGGVFEFEKPITQIDKLTVTFGNPLEPIVFDKDRLVVSVQYTDPAQFITSEPHNLSTADQVYFTDFKTGDPVADQDVINSVNSVNGHNVFVVDDTTFEIDGLDLSALSSPITSFTMVCFFGSKRVFIPMELVFLTSTSNKVSE